MKTLSLVAIFVAVLSQNTFALFQGGPCIRGDGLKGVCTSTCKQSCTSTLAGDVCGFQGVKTENAIGCCIEHEKLLYPTLEGICTYYHRNSTGACFDLPVGGKKNNAQLHTSVAAIGWASLNGIQWKCGGSLISNNHVLTSAHCLVGEFKSPEYVRVSTLKLTDVPEPGDYSVSKVIYHPEYDPATAYHDLAILFVERQSEPPQNQIVLPACLWMHDDYKSWDGTIYDYKEGGPVRNVNVEAWQLVSNIECRNSYSGHELFPNGLTEGLFCAATDVRKPNCNPLGSRALAQKSANIPFVIGISAYRGSCEPRAANVFTRIYPYLPWIEEVVSF